MNGSAGRRVAALLTRLLSAADKFPLFRLLPVLYIGLALLFTWFISRGDIQLLNPAGTIAEQQSRLLWGVLALMVVTGAAMIGAFFYVVVRYREGSHGHHESEWTAGPGTMGLGWLAMLVVILGASLVVWVTAHDVDPYRSLSSSKTPVTIQVVSLQWKWLFLYPHERLATVNQLEIPVDTPVTFELTADSPMNSFWVPRLSGQMYAMTGMMTQLHIKADKVGDYQGHSAELSGDEFAGMDFTVHVVPTDEYQAWTRVAHEEHVASGALTYTSYKRLARPTSYVRPDLYTLEQPNLFDMIMLQFMEPGSDTSNVTVRGQHL